MATSDRIVLVHMLRYLCGLLVTTGESLTHFYLHSVHTMTDRRKISPRLPVRPETTTIVTTLQHLRLYCCLAIKKISTKTEQSTMP